MLRKSFNNDWMLLKPGESPLMAMMGGAGNVRTVTLPHDAMIEETRTQETKNHHQTGFYPGGCYTYTKMFEAPAQWQDQDVFLEFEGVYKYARVYVNGDYAGGHPYGYTEFTVKLNDFLHFGAMNMIQVIADNSDEENSRWYSGSGIYRNVNLLVGGPVYIGQNSLKVFTPEVEEDLCVAVIRTALVNRTASLVKTTLRTTLYAPDGSVAGRDEIPVTLFGRDTEKTVQRIAVENPALWNVDTPNLYRVQVEVLEGESVLDTAAENFGFRKLSLTANRGLRINGTPVNLRGACIHHDNGILGAAAFARAEERKVQLLKAAGFNCIRSSHNPMSREMLDACDREGMLVLDELFDEWTRSKNNNDYALQMPYFWEKDASALVAKDFNHPCVILYISGNEIQEAGTAKGAQMNRLITEKLHSLDPSRYVTVAVNGLLACMDRMGEIICDITGLTMEQLQAMQSQSQSQEDKVQGGADAANGSLDLMKGPMADAFAADHIVGDTLNEFASVTDLAGYNYLTARHEMEHKLHPNRVILGTETLPSDMVRLWKIVKENPHVIGDMTWTGWDYIGEAGSGCFYYDGRQGFMANWPISLAGMGDIDILGNRRPISYFREIVYGLRKDPYIAVERVNHYGQKPNQSAWMWKDELESWTFAGYEGKGAVVNVYSDAEEVELFLNGKSLGKKPTGEENGYLASFDTVYEPGTLKAVNYRQGKAAESFCLTTAAPDVELSVSCDRPVLAAGEADLAYLMVSLKDEGGTFNPQAVKTVTVSVEGEGTLQAVGNADPATENAYTNHTWETYDGHLLAVVRSGKQQGEIRVTFSAKGCREQTVILRVE